MENAAAKNMIDWDRPKLERFKKALATAPRVDDVFVFDGNEFVANFAKYLIEYLETQLPKS